MKKLLGLLTVGVSILFGTFVHAGALQNVSWSATDYGPSAIANYTFTFTADEDINDPHVSIDFPAGFNYVGSNLYNGDVVVSVDTINGGTPFYSDNIETGPYPMVTDFGIALADDRQNPVTITSGSIVTITIANVENTSTIGSYAWPSDLYYGNGMGATTSFATLSAIDIVYPDPFERCMTNSGNINIPYEECISLAYLYTETDGDNWDNRDGWFANFDVTQWDNDRDCSGPNDDYYYLNWSDMCDSFLFVGDQAIILTGDGPVYNVYGINLGYNELRGSIGSGLLGLPELTYLLLNDNGLEGINLSANTKLKYLNLDENDEYYDEQADEYVTITWPSIDLSNNPELDYIDFDELNLGSIVGLTQTGLVYIDATDNNFTSFDISALTDLRYINLSYNNSLASFTGQYGHQSLEYIGIEEADLSGTIAFEDMPELREIQLSDNSLTSINLSNVPNLVDLDLSDNNINGSFGLDGYEYLYDVDLAYNNISAVSMSNLPALYELNINDNQITSLSLENLDGLQYLNVYRNLLTSLNLSNLPIIYQINAYDNLLASASFTNLPSLDYLYLEDNQLTTLTVEDLTGLQYLNAGNNLLTSINLDNLTALSTLYLDDNLFTSITLADLSNLNSVYLSDNPLISLTLTNLPIANLNLDNALPSVVNITGVTQPMYLYLKYNELTSIPTWVNTDINIQSLYLSHNRITTLPADFQSQYEDTLFYIDLNNNCLSESFDTNLVSWLSRGYNAYYQLYCEYISLDDTIQGPATISNAGLLDTGEGDISDDTEIVRNGFLGDFIGIRTAEEGDEYYDAEDDEWYYAYTPTDFTLTYTWDEAVTIGSVSVWREENESIDGPGDYQFSYWNGSTWITPSEWIAGEGDQSFRTEHNFALSTPITTTMVRLLKPGEEDDDNLYMLSQFLVYGESEEEGAPRRRSGGPRFDPNYTPSSYTVPDWQAFFKSIRSGEDSAVAGNQFTVKAFVTDVFRLLGVPVIVQWKESHTTQVVPASLVKKVWSILKNKLSK